MSIRPVLAAAVRRAASRAALPPTSSLPRIPGAVCCVARARPAPAFAAAARPVYCRTVTPGDSMRNTKIALVLATIAMVATSTALASAKTSSLEGIDWVRDKMAVYPELEWLADKETRATTEGQATASAPYSQQIFGTTYIEFDRSIGSLHCFRLIYEGRYEEFVANQSEDKKLSRENFNKLHQWALSLIHSKIGNLSEHEVIQTIETALVLGDMGKSPKARARFADFDATAADHDHFYAQMLSILETHPHLCPSLAALPEAAKRVLLRDPHTHFGHVAHGEGDPYTMLSSLRRSGLGSQPQLLDFFFISHLCDVAGALSHVKKGGSLVITEETYTAMMAMFDSLRKFSDPRMTEWEVYHDYMGFRANLVGINPNLPGNLTLMRMVTFLRLFTPTDGEIVKRVPAQFTKEQWAKIIEQFEPKKEGLIYCTATYLPAFVVNLSNNPTLGESREMRLEKALILGLPFAAEVLAHYKAMVDRGVIGRDVALSFMEVAAIAKSNPERLKNAKFEINSEGMIKIVS